MSTSAMNRENHMDRTTLLRKLETMFAEIERQAAWGNVEIEFRDGVANMVRITKNEKLTTQENTRGRQPYR